MAFFSNKRFGFPHKEVRDVSACAVDSTRDMLKQMCLPLIPERRVKGALSVVSRETGLPFSKVRRLYYGITDHILAFEWSAIEATYSAWLLKQERQLENDIENIRALRTARLQGRLHLHADTQDGAPSMALADSKTMSTD